MEHRVNVHIIPDTNTSVPRDKSLVKLFKDAMFTNVENYVTKTAQTKDVKISDESRILSCVSDDLQKESRLETQNPVSQLYTCIIKDTSVTACSADTIKDIIQYIIGVRGFDICYLCKWNDKCHLYTSQIATTLDRHVNLVRTRSPNGLQAILISPSGRDILLRRKPMLNGEYLGNTDSLDKRLNTEIYNGNIIAMCTSINIFNYDTCMNATNNKDYEKLCECVNATLNNENTGSGGVNGAWIIVTILFILMLGWAVLRIGPRG